MKKFSHSHIVPLRITFNHSVWMFILYSVCDYVCAPTLCVSVSVRTRLSACPSGRLKVYQARVPVCDPGERDPRQQRTAAAYNIAFNSLTECCSRCAVGEAPSALQGPHFWNPTHRLWERGSEHLPRTSLSLNARCSVPRDNIYPCETEASAFLVFLQFFFFETYLACVRVVSWWHKGTIRGRKPSAEERARWEKRRVERDQRLNPTLNPGWALK